MWGVKTLATFGSATARLFAGCNEFKVGSSVVEVAAKPSTMALRGKLVGLVLVFGGMLSVSANDVEEMGQEIYEETLESGLYPGNEFRTKLYLHPGITWFRITLQNKPGNPLINASVVALSIRVDIDVSAGFKGHIERNWLDATGASQLNPSERSIIGEFPFYLDYVFEVVLYSGLQDFEFQVNGLEKFVFAHGRILGNLADFDVLRIMASPNTLDVCWAKFNLKLLQVPTVSSEVSGKCIQQVQRSVCDDLVCHLFLEEHNMYTSTANPGSLSVSDGVRTSLEEMTEQFCCLEGLVKDLDKHGDDTLQVAVDIATELLLWNGNASWNDVKELSNNGPLSLMDRLDDIAQALGPRLTLGKRIQAHSPVVSCSLESNSLGTFILNNWTYQPFHTEEDMISIQGMDLANLGFKGTERISVLGAAYTNLTGLINYNQKGADKFIVADVITATVFGPDGQISVPTTFRRRLSNIQASNSTHPRIPVCAFWDSYLRGRVAGGWSTKGCKTIWEDGQSSMEASNGDYITCHCNHTTNYAILMRIVPYEKPIGISGRASVGISDRILDILTMVGCIVSILALLTALAFFVFFKHSTLDTERILIHCNLMGTLLVAMVVFMISTYFSGGTIPCKIFAGLLHYLYLAVFCWMLVESVHLYRLIVTVYGSERQMAKLYCAIGWGLPILIVGVSAGIKWTHYGLPGKGCWLSTQNGFIWAFVGPACVIMLVNAVVLAMVIRTTVAASKGTSRDTLAKVKAGLRSSLVLLPMLGITWGVGLIGHVSPVFEYTFVILNSFQGFWLVIVCCLLNGEVRQAFHLTIKKMGKFSGTVDAISTTGNEASKQREKESKGNTCLTDVD